jgi:hypothetical protein
MKMEAVSGWRLALRKKRSPLDTHGCNEGLTGASNFIDVIGGSSSYEPLTANR